MKKRRYRKEEWWTQGIRSASAGRKLRLVPYWEAALVDGDRLNIVVDPGPSFGAGEHPSTLMALELLEQCMEAWDREESGPSVLDAGTGTGVLLIAAMALGAGLAVGFDIDPAAIYTARHNLRLNRSVMDNMPGSDPAFFVGTAHAVGRGFDVVLANLAAPTLIRLSTDLITATDDSLVLSGVADAMVDRVEETYINPDLQLITRMKKEGWNAFLFKKPGPR